MPKSLSAASNRACLPNGVHYIQKENLLLVTIPKNSSTTMRQYLERNWDHFGGRHSIENMQSWGINDDPDILKNDPKICVILRDPFARHLSATSMLVGNIATKYGIKVNPSDFKMELDRVSDLHMLPQWSFIPLTNVPAFEESQNFFLTKEVNTWNKLYQEIMNKYDFDGMITDKYDFFWMSEDPKENVWMDVCNYYNIPPMEIKHHVSTDRKDKPLNDNIGKFISTVHKYYSADYDFIHRVKFRNLKY